MRLEQGLKTWKAVHNSLTPRSSSNMSHILRRILSAKPCAVRRFRGLLISHSEGGALVETALVVPVMLTLITGMASFGIALNNYLLLSHAAAVGARYVAINQGNFSNGTTTNPCAMAATQIQASAI